MNNKHIIVGGKIFDKDGSVIGRASRNGSPALQIDVVDNKKTVAGNRLIEHDTSDGRRQLPLSGWSIYSRG